MNVIVTAFINDNASNIVKSIEEDIGILRVLCVGHTLNLVVQEALKKSCLATILAWCRKIV